MDLGVVVTIENPNESEANFQRAREAGFWRGLVRFSWRQCTATMVRHVALAAKNQGFETIAVQSNANLLRLSDASTTSTDESDLMSLAENMAMLDGCTQLVLWSGSYARKWEEPNLLNQGEDAYFAMVFELRRMMGRLSGIPLSIMLQPCYAHILHDVATCLRIADDFPSDQVCLALDVAYLVAPTMYSKHPQVLPQIVSALAPLSNLTMVSDLHIEESVVTHPLPGRGVVNLPTIMSAIKASFPEDKPLLINSNESMTASDLARSAQSVTAAMSVPTGS